MEEEKTGQGRLGLKTSLITHRSDWLCFRYWKKDMNENR